MWLISASTCAGLSYRFPSLVKDTKGGDLVHTFDSLILLSYPHLSLPSRNPLNQADEIIAQLGAQISALQRSLAERGRAIVEMDGEIRALKQAVGDHRRQLEHERQFIVAMFVNSVSWRLTVPVRVIGGAFRKVKLFLFSILSIAPKDVPGGPTPALGPAPE